MRKVFYLLSLIFLMSACTHNNTQPQNNMEVMPQGVSVTDSHIKMNNSYARTDDLRAQHLTNLATSIPNVNNATALVLGNIAIVGIEVAPDVDRSKVGTIKYSVLEGLRHDPQGAGAVVIADPDIYTRLIEMRREIAAGRPIQGIMNELSDIVGRLMPDVPLPEAGKNPQDAMERQKNDMNQTDDRELNKIQQNQSNHRK